MMGTSAKEQQDAEPLAPAIATRRGGSNRTPTPTNISVPFHRRHRRCATAVLVLAVILSVLVIVIVILALTVFKAKEPKIKLDKISIQGLALNSTGNGLQYFPMSSGSGSGGSSSTDVTVTLQAEMSIKNPNAASFRFSNATTALYYQGINIGEATNPSGNARARRTLTMNVTVDVWTSKLMQLASSSSQLADDVARRSMNVETASVIKGRVKILGFIKKHVKVEMNCTMTIDLSTNIGDNDVHLQHCDRHVTL